MFYSIRWEKIPPAKYTTSNVFQVQTTFLDESGEVRQFIRQYEDWLGVCTNHIDRVIHTIQQYFPNCAIRYSQLGNARKILPYFETRLQSGKLNSSLKPFYKIYMSTCLADVGRLLHTYKVSYYDENDWLVRLYIDFQAQGFYYKWYTVTDEPWLLDSFHMHPERTQAPDWTVGAFDLETVPMDGSHRVPTGLDASDEIVMISLYIWNQRQGLQHWLLYRLPCDMTPLDMSNAHAYTSERSMLNDFHALIQPCQVLTGYNINQYDFPFLFARLVWLNMTNVLLHYSSSQVGQVLVTTFQKKLVLDLYQYVKVFSHYDLPSLKLDDVARKKLNEAKVPVHSTGIWAWYTHSEVTPSLVESKDVDTCHAVLQPHRLTVHQFGTFRDYLTYCLKDSFLVYRIFQKEMVLSFLVERANFTAWNAVAALCMGNSSFILELFKTYGTVLGFFVNTRFMKSPIHPKRYASLFITKNNSYQGALNYCIPQKTYKNVAVMDFASMYPSALLSSNLCYSTCTIMTREEWLACPRAQQLTSIPYRIHGDLDFEKEVNVSDQFQYPSYSPESEEAFVMVMNGQADAFLPCIVKHFITLRQHHQRQYKDTRDVYHYNVQLCIKILINSLYGVMGTKESSLAYLPIAMIIVTLARYQLLGSYHFVKRLGYSVCYADTDSLMVHRWPIDCCRMINEYLNIPHVELKFEQRMQKLIVLSKKKYMFQNNSETITTKGFAKRMNELIEFLNNLVLKTTWNYIYRERKKSLENHSWLEKGLSLNSRGWLLWSEVVQKARYKCRNTEKYSICRKTKHLSEYKSQKCAAVRMLKKHPEKANDYIEYTYSRADVFKSEASKWVMDVKDCRWVNYEKLFVNQRKLYCMLMNMAFWRHTNIPVFECDMVLNACHWKALVLAELLFWHTHRRTIILLLEETGTYTFRVNNHTKTKRKAKPPKKIEILEKRNAIKREERRKEMIKAFQTELVP